jgi:hypothetical protein
MGEDRMEIDEDRERGMVTGRRRKEEEIMKEREETRPRSLA